MQTNGFRVFLKNVQRFPYQLCCGSLTLRQLFWRLASAGEVHNDVENYRRLIEIMTELHEEGRYPSGLIVDRAALTIDGD